MAHVFISYSARGIGDRLARVLYADLLAAGHTAFMASESIRWGQDWEHRISVALETCDYFLLLLSEEALLSDMVAGEVRRAFRLREQRGRPVLLPLRVQVPFDTPIGYELDSYLHRVQQYSWSSDSDTDTLMVQLRETLVAASAPPPLESDGPPPRPGREECPPLPTAPLELPEGQVAIDSVFYVERDSDRRSRDQISGPGALVRIKAPRQYGKTSLLSRLVCEARATGMTVVSLSLQQLESQTIGDLDRLLRQLCSYASRKLGVTNRTMEFWDDAMSLKERCRTYFEEYLLPKCPQGLLLSLDEADRLFEYQGVSNEFFGMLRSWHEEGKLSVEWRRFKLVLSHSTEVYLAISDPNQSPFNVGYSVQLAPFSDEAILDLAHRHGLRGRDADWRAVGRLLGGHPYLVRRAMFEVRDKAMSTESLVHVASSDEGPFGDHLRRHLWNLSRHAELADAMRAVLRGDWPGDPFVLHRLLAAGLIRGTPPNVTASSPLYERYLTARL